MSERAMKAGYICGECADKEGGVWPEGHAATFHGGKCPLCGETKSLASWDDWSWPNDAKINKRANARREI